MHSCQLCVHCHHILGWDIWRQRHTLTDQSTGFKSSVILTYQQKLDQSINQSNLKKSCFLMVGANSRVWFAWDMVIDTYTRTSFLLSLGWNLTLKLLVVTSPGYFLSSRFSWSSSSPSDEVYDGAIYSTWRRVKCGSSAHWKKQFVIFYICNLSQWCDSSKSDQYLFVVFLFDSALFGEVQWLLPLRLNMALRQGGSNVLRGWRRGGLRLWRLSALSLSFLHAEIQGAVLIHFNVWFLPGSDIQVVQLR